MPPHGQEAAIIHVMSVGEDTAQLLGRVPLFSGVPERDLAELAQVAVPRSWLAGEVVFREGDAGDTCYVIRSGSVRITRRHSDGRQLALAELHEGDIFGELAMFGGETRSATVEAAEPTEALALLAGDLRRTMLAHPDLAVAVPPGLRENPADRPLFARGKNQRQSGQRQEHNPASKPRIRHRTPPSRSDCAYEIHRLNLGEVVSPLR